MQLEESSNFFIFVPVAPWVLVISKYAVDYALEKLVKSDPESAGAEPYIRISKENIEDLCILAKSRISKPGSLDKYGLMKTPDAFNRVTVHTCRILVGGIYAEWGALHSETLLHDMASMYGKRISVIKNPIKELVSETLTFYNSIDPFMTSFESCGVSNDLPI